MEQVSFPHEADSWDMIQRLIAWLVSLLGKAPVKPQNAPQAPLPTQTTPIDVPVAVSQITPKATLTNMCKSIALIEGANPANHNPANARYYSDGYAPYYGHVGMSPGGFAMFANDELGWHYLHEMVKGKILKHPEWTLLDFFSSYAPVEDDNDPVHYSQVVAKAIGVDNTTFKIKDIMLV